MQVSGVSHYYYLQDIFSLLMFNFQMILQIRYFDNKGHYTKNMHDLIPEIEKIITPIVDEHGYELVETKAVGLGNSSVLRIFVFDPRGITVDGIAVLSRIISKELDKVDIIRHKYFLEVSSSGLDRELRSVKDFTRVVSENIRVVELSGNITEGELTDANPVHLVLKTEDEIIEIPYKNVSLGKIIY